MSDDERCSPAELLRVYGSARGQGLDHMLAVKVAARQERFARDYLSHLLHSQRSRYVHFRAAGVTRERALQLADVRYEVTRWETAGWGTDGRARQLLRRQALRNAYREARQTGQDHAAAVARVAADLDLDVAVAELRLRRDRERLERQESERAAASHDELSQ